MIRTSKLLTDIDPADDKIYYSIFSGVNGKEVINGNFLGFASEINSLYLFTETGGYKINANTFKIISEDYKSWFSFPVSIKGAPSAFMQTTRPMQMLVENGLVHIWDHRAMGSTAFGDRLNGDYIAAPYLPAISTSTFSTVIFDNKNKRYASINQFGSSVGVIPSTNNAAFDLNNIGTSKEIVFMDNGFNEYTYTIFYDVEKSIYELYVADFSGNIASPVAKYAMGKCSEVNRSTKYAFANRGNVCFYSSGSKIYQYKYSSTNDSETVFTFSGEIITGLNVFKNAKHEKNGKLLIVSTLDNNEMGKIYLVEFNELTGAMTGGIQATFEGFGKIADILIKE